MKIKQLALIGVVAGAVLVTGVLSVCADSTPGMDQWLGWVLIPGKQAGPIDQDTSEADLIEIYGMHNVMEKGPSWDSNGLPVHQEPTTLLFANDVGRCAEITWKDPETKQHPKGVSLCCTRCYWRTAEGITIGTEAHRLEKMNGVDYVFHGFGAADGGKIESWNSGHLDDSLPASVASVTMDYHHEIKLLPADQNTLQSTGLLQSEDPSAQKAYPFISALSVSLETPPDELAQRTDR